MTASISVLFIIIVLTLISGYGDARGFYHASKIWQDNKIVWAELIKSAIGFGVGVNSYWAVLRYLRLAGIRSPELQTILWFGVTSIGVALLSRDFLNWSIEEKIIGLLVITGIGWLLVQTNS